MIPKLMSKSGLPFGKRLALCCALSVLVACGGSGGGGSSPPELPNNGNPGSGNPPVGQPPANTPPVNDPPPTTGRPPEGSVVATTRLHAARFLTQATFGPTEELIDEFMRPEAQGGFGGVYEKWIDSQLSPAMSAPSYMEYVNTAGGNFLIGLFWRHAKFGPDQLRQRMAFALSQIFVTTVDRDFFPEAWRYGTSASYQDLLKSSAYGRYRDVLQDVSLHPYMGMYLGTLRNQKESADGLIIPDQNYAREVMQLFSIGLYQLNPDGTTKRDAQGQPIPTYNNSDIAGLSRVFTGWGWNHGPGSNTSFNTDCGLREINCNYMPMKGFNSHHSTLEKTFLGKTIPAGTDIQGSLKQALDHIASHPNVAPFMARRLIQQFVTSNPSREYIGRVSGVFTSTGGDLGRVIKAILLDPEARDIHYANNTETFGKLREPAIRLANWMRAFELTTGNGTPLDGSPVPFHIASKKRELCQYPMSAPSVFNFWRPGYVPNAAFASRNLVAPEMQVVHEVCVASYLQMMKAVIDGTKDNSSTAGISEFGLTDGDGVVRIKSSYAREVNLDSTALVARMNELLAAGRMPVDLQNQIKTAVDSIPPTSDANRLRRVKVATLLTMASPEYLVQK
jgi:uncharacterized protein (DUF1800 family)